MLTLAEMITDFRNHLDALGDSFFSDAEIVRRLHSSQQEIIRAMQKEDPTFYVGTKVLDLVADQATYALPLNARLGSRIIFAQNTALPTGGLVPATVLEALVDLELPNVINLTEHWHFAIQGDKVRVMQTPGAANPGAITVWYVPTYGNMIQGKPTSATSDTIVASTSQLSPDYTTYYGKLDQRNDYYNGMKIHITDGTGVGQTREITDYVGSTRTLTVDSSWDTTPDTTSVFYVASPVPEDHHHIVPLRAALTGAIKNRNRQDDLAAEYYGHRGRMGALPELIGWISKRQESRLERVQPYDLGN